MKLETKCLEEGKWVGIVDNDAYICGTSNYAFTVSSKDYQHVPGCLFHTENDVIEAFKIYAKSEDEKKKEEERLKALAGVYEWKDGEVVPYVEPF